MTSTRVRSGYAPAGDGQIYFEAAGNGTALVMIHGAAVDRRFWDYNFEALAEHFFVVRHDRRSHGKSSLAAGPYSDHGDLVCLMDFLKIERAVLCAHSGGSRAAYGAAFLHPGRVAGLISASGSSAWVLKNVPSAQDVIAEAAASGPARIVNVAREQGVEAALAGLSELNMFARTRAMPDVWAKMAQMFRDFPAHNWTNPVPGSQFDGDPEPLFRSLRMPVIALVGQEEGRLYRDAMRAIAGWVPGAQFQVIPDAGHPYPMENPEAFNEAVREFVSTIQRGPRS